MQLWIIFVNYICKLIIGFALFSYILFQNAYSWHAYRLWSAHSGRWYWVQFQRVPFTKRSTICSGQSARFGLAAAFGDRHGFYSLRVCSRWRNLTEPAPLRRKLQLNQWGQCSTAFISGSSRNSWHNSDESSLIENRTMMRCLFSLLILITVSVLSVTNHSTLGTPYAHLLWDHTHWSYTWIMITNHHSIYSISSLVRSSNFRCQPLFNIFRTDYL